MSVDPQFAELAPHSPPSEPSRAARPAGFLSRLSVGQKLALAGLLLGVPFAVSLGKLVADRNQAVAHLRDQLEGQAMLAPVQEIMKQTQLIRRSSVTLPECTGHTEPAA